MRSCDFFYYNVGFSTALRTVYSFIRKQVHLFVQQAKFCLCSHKLSSKNSMCGICELSLVCYVVPSVIERKGRHRELFASHYYTHAFFQKSKGDIVIAPIRPSVLTNRPLLGSLNFRNFNNLLRDKPYLHIKGTNIYKMRFIP